MACPSGKNRDIRYIKIRSDIVKFDLMQLFKLILVYVKQNQIPFFPVSFFLSRSVGDLTGKISFHIRIISSLERRIYITIAFLSLRYKFSHPFPGISFPR